MCVGVRIFIMSRYLYGFMLSAANLREWYISPAKKSCTYSGNSLDSGPSTAANCIFLCPCKGSHQWLHGDIQGGHIWGSARSMASRPRPVRLSHAVGVRYWRTFVWWIGTTVEISPLAFSRQPKPTKKSRVSGHALSRCTISRLILMKKCPTL